jgi:transglutaminase-like putative cysteine protease
MIHPTPPHPDDALASDVHVDSDHPLLMRHLQAAVSGEQAWTRLERWYVRVRDGIRYNPWRITFNPESIRASGVLEDQEGHCVAKSLLFVAGCRALGIPAVMGYARVRNHLATEKLEAKLGTNVLSPHGYAAFWNGEKWVKCTPVFNAELCAKYGVQPLPFSIHEDVMFQASTSDGSTFMTYEEDYGLYTELPVKQLETWFRQAYPHIDPDVDFKDSVA